MNSRENRVTIKLKRPNPLFEDWLTEWRDKAKEKSSKMEHCFSKALDSLRKYPLPLERGRDCKILNGFGDKLCRMLDKRLDDHDNQRNDSDPDKTIEYVLEDADAITKRSIATTASPEKSPSPPKRNKKQYVPMYRSGAYAIVMVLYESFLVNADDNFMGKNDIIAKAQRLCDKSFSKSDNGSYYTAWSSMKMLLDKKLVRKQGNPAKFALTSAGCEVGKNICGGNTSDPIENVKVIPAVSDPDPKPSQSSSNEIQKNVVTDFETVLFPPFTFEVILIVDKQETAGSKEKLQNDPVLSELTNLDVRHEVKHLKVGDYVWICRDHSSNTEMVLPYVVERKRMDDFGSSIKDGRYHEQKFRLKQCGMQNVIYLIESHGDNKHTGLPLSTLYQAATNTLLQDGFVVKFSAGLRGTAQYLNCMTKILKENYESKTVMTCPKINLEKSSFDDDLIPLISFQEFNQSGSKYKSYTASEMFIKQLVQLKGLSVDKALAIVERYPTVKLLKVTCDNDVESTETHISNVQFGKKKRIGPAIANTLCKFYKSHEFP